jgi:fructokinase
MPNHPTVVALGEILWDVFPNGPKFGGAPANFACTTAELASDRMDVYIVGAVGRDDLGDKAIELLRSHGVNTTCVSQVAQPTGQVNVTLDNAGKPTFEIATDTAWDNLPWSNELEQLATRADAVCFGTLAQRSPTSRDTIRKFVQSTRPDCLRILDINLRPPFWTDDVVRESLRFANVLKLNDSELPQLARILNLSGCEDEQLASLLQTNNLKGVALTRGADGATILSATGERSTLPAPPAKIVDTVGAGDAYTAALAIGLLSGLPLERINAWGNQVASYVCSQAGGSPHLPPNLRRAESDVELKSVQHEL